MIFHRGPTGSLALERPQVDKKPAPVHIAGNRHLSCGLLPKSCTEADQQAEQCIAPFIGTSCRPNRILQLWSAWMGIEHSRPPNTRGSELSGGKQKRAIAVADRPERPLKGGPTA